MAPPLKVVVIGAGVAGLTAARALKVEGLQVSVYEKMDRLGGIWVYDPRVESDPLGLDPDREVVHGSLYSSLRTNNPRLLMGILDYPFGSRKNGDSRIFPGHEEMLIFLNEFAEEFGLVELIRFNTEVIRVERVGSRNDEWVVGSRTGQSESEAVFDAVVINYVDENGMVSFEDGARLHADIILHCTGYNYHFPFLRTEGMVSVDDNRVGPLYKHVFPPKLAPNLAFVGLTYRGAVSLVIDLQAKWVAKVISGKSGLPSQEEMLADVERHYQDMEEKGIPKHYTHSLRKEVSYEYMDWLAHQAGTPEVDDETKLKCKSYFNFVADKGVWRAREWEPTKGLQPQNC
ncbi:UNVERIFIED_CONTAM: Flavin-containing monooxygenase FMO GS-OX-like 2 [Sesamum radiatum]|uniref:Flavin-containing monooxygenase n=1 Tax=Sesamum radiatum TaxID=300843 RepID=A0AAW2VIM4_SESRA